MKNQKYNNIILGSGVAGLTVFYYLSQLTATSNLVITNALASQTTGPFPLGPRFLHLNKDTEALLRRLKLSTETREVFIGYKSGDEIRNYPTDGFKEAYAQSSRGTSNVESSFLSGGAKSGFTAFKVSQPEIANVIYEKCIAISEKSDLNSIIINNIKLIEHNKITTDQNTYYTNNFISTIPLPALLKVVSNQSKTFKITSEPEEITFFLVDESGKGHFDYIYSVSDCWHRKTYFNEQDKWVYETRKPLDFVAEKKNILNSVTMKTQITNSLNLKEIGNIKLVGRFAQMNHSIKTEDVIKWAYNYTRKFNEKKT
jgi:hypothetical protein